MSAAASTPTPSRVPIAAARYAFWPTPRGSGFHIATPDMFRKALAWHAGRTLSGLEKQYVDHTAGQHVDLSIEFDGFDLTIDELTGDGRAFYYFSNFYLLDPGNDETAMPDVNSVSAQSIGDMLDALRRAEHGPLARGVPTAIRILRTWEAALDNGFDQAIASGLAKVYGRPRDPLAPIEHVTASQWRYFTLMDADQGVAEGYGGARLYDLHLEIAPRRTTTPAVEQVIPLQRRPRGRRPAVDWNDIEKALAAHVEQVGMPGPDNEEDWQRPADVERWAHDLIMDRWGKELGVTTVRGRVSGMLARMEGQKISS